MPRLGVPDVANYTSQVICKVILYLFLRNRLFLELAQRVRVHVELSWKGMLAGYLFVNKSVKVKYNSL